MFTECPWSHTQRVTAGGRCAQVWVDGTQVSPDPGLGSPPEAIEEGGGACWEVLGESTRVDRSSPPPQDHSTSILGVASSIAHELGHSLGLDHDLPGTRCPWPQLMASTPDQGWGS